MQNKLCLECKTKLNMHSFFGFFRLFDLRGEMVLFYRVLISTKKERVMWTEKDLIIMKRDFMRYLKFMGKNLDNNMY